jgi:hypothetical protein
LVQEEVIDNPLQPYKRKPSLPMIAGFLLIVAGVIAIVLWAQVITVDEASLEEVVNLEDFKQVNPNITITEVKEMIQTCAIIGIIISIFPILGGVLALRRKMFKVTLVCGFLGILLVIPSIISGILSIVAVIFIFMSKKEFQTKLPES